jgi:hypothetical protein
MVRSKFTLTLVFYLGIALALTPSYASVDLNRRHANLNRIIKKRAPADIPPLVPIGAGADPATQSSSGIASLTGLPSNDPVPSQSASTNGAGGPAQSVSSAASSDSSSSSSSVSSSVSSSSSSAATTSSASEIHSVSAAPNIPTASFGAGSTEVYLTSTASVPAASATASVTPSGSSSKHTTITVLIVIASAIAGVAIIWTIIRKWKFRPSSQFEDRMQPIDWQPTACPEDGLPGHRRMGSNASSFHSASHNDNMAGRGVGGGLDVVPTMAPLPDHDFTAGPAHLAPVGGYADLARGPSPQPQMQESLTRGPSMNRQYDQFGAPIHPQVYTQDAYEYDGKAY